MNSILRRPNGFALFTLLGVCLSSMGCATYKPLPDFGDAQFMTAPPRTLTLMPIVDARKDKTAANIDVQNEVTGPLLAKMRDRGFQVVAAPSFASPVPAQEMAEMSDAELAKLLPSGAPAAMVVFIDDATTTYVIMAKTSKVDISSRIVEPASGRLLWKKRAVFSEGQGGLISGLLPTESAAFDDCLSALARNLPSPPK